MTHGGRMRRGCELSRQSHKKNELHHHHCRLMRGATQRQLNAVQPHSSTHNLHEPVMSSCPQAASDLPHSRPPNGTHHTAILNHVTYVETQANTTNYYLHTQRSITQVQTTSGTADQHGVHATIYDTSTDNDERHRRPERRTRNDLRQERHRRPARCTRNDLRHEYGQRRAAPPTSTAYTQRSTTRVRTTTSGTADQHRIHTTIYYREWTMSGTAD